MSKLTCFKILILKNVFLANSIAFHVSKITVMEMKGSYY
jgi:hypothetical protein